MGSGTSAVVSKLLGHNYVGIELSSEYIEKANNRINNVSQKEINDFSKEISLHFVTQTYSDRKEKKNTKFVEPNTAIKEDKVDVDENEHSKVVFREGQSNLFARE
jgi:hypothetical protein